MKKWYPRPTLSTPEIADAYRISGCDPWREFDQGDPCIATPRHRKKLGARSQRWWRLAPSFRAVWAFKSETAANDSARQTRRELAQAAP
jgi:hypothetical protein